MSCELDDPQAIRRNVLREVAGSKFVLAGLLASWRLFTVIALAAARRSTGYIDLLLPAAAIIASSVMTSHSMARWIIVRRWSLSPPASSSHCGLAGRPAVPADRRRRPPTPDFARRLSARFSQLALASVAVLASAGLLLSFAYVAHSRRLRYFLRRDGRYQSASLCLLLFLGALNFQLVRRGPASSILASLKRFGEAEIGIGITVISPPLRSLTPSRRDLTHDRVTGPESSPACLHARQDSTVPLFRSCRRNLRRSEKASNPARLSAESYVPGQTGTRPNTSAEKAWSEYNHHWAGIVVLAMGLLALIAQRDKSPGRAIGRSPSSGSRHFFFSARSGDLASRARRLLGDSCGSGSTAASFFRSARNSAGDFSNGACKRAAWPPAVHG